MPERELFAPGASCNMQVCNACRYCEGFCAVFPAMERRLDVRKARPALPRQSLPQLRRVLLRLPVRAAARVRTSTSRATSPRFAPRPTAATPGPGSLASLFERNGVVVSLATAAALALFLFATFYYQARDVVFAAHPGGDFYKVHPAQRHGLDLRRGRALRAARADDRVRPVLARDRRADARAGRAGVARARHPGCAAPQEPAGRRRRLPLSRRAAVARAADLPPPDVLRLHVLLRRDLRRDDLSLRVRLEGALCADQPARRARHASAASGSSSGRSACYGSSRGAIPTRTNRRSSGWTPGSCGCCC